MTKLDRLKKLFKKKPKLNPNAKRWVVDGVNVCLRWENKRIYGWTYGMQDGDILSVKMKSGKTALFEIKNVNYSPNVSDMYFADIIGIGYE